MTTGEPVSFAYALSGPLAGRPLETDGETAAALEAEDLAWLHLKADHPAADEWIDGHLGYLDPSIRDALTETQTRPRALKIGGGLLVILRGINLNEGADPEDMVSLRLYLDPARIVSLSRRPLQSIELLAERVRAGGGPTRAGSFLADLVELLTDRIEAQVTDLEERSDQLEAATIENPEGDLRPAIADQRLELTELRRFLGPQREAVREMARGSIRWLTEADERKLDEQLDQLTRVTETLEALREQLHTIRDEIEGARADRLNRNLYVLSVISAVFLPLSFLTGLMGINIGGMPGVDNADAFWIFTFGLIGVGIGVLAILRYFRIL